MPRKGYRSTTIKEDLYKETEEEAKKRGVSVMRFIADCLKSAIIEVPAQNG